MALDLNFSICQSKDCESLIFSELTGAFNLVSNPGGWGNPRPETTDATSVLLKVLIPDATTTVDIDLSADFPTTDEDFQYEITSEDLGGDADSKLTDGIYEFTYEVIADGVTYTEKKDIFIYCNVQCCISSYIAKIPSKSCSCSDSAVSDALTAFMLMKSLEYAAACGKRDKFTNTLSVLNNICQNTGCTDC